MTLATSGIGMDAYTGEIVAAALMTKEVDDGSQANPFARPGGGISVVHKSDAWVQLPQPRSGSGSATLL